MQLTSDGHRACLDAVEDAFGADVDYAQLLKLYGESPEAEKRYSLTNAFSKKFESHVHMVALYTVWYNWVRIHRSLRVTPAMAAGLTDKLMGFEDIVALMDARAEKPNRPATYKKRAQISN